MTTLAASIATIESVCAIAEAQNAARIDADPFAPAALHPPVDPNIRTWRLVIPGEPIAKGRPKFTTVNGFARAYTPKKTERYEDTIRYFARREWHGEPLAGVAIYARIIAYRSIPSSLAKSKRQAAIDGAIRPITRPDVDNYQKICCDALSGIVFADDAAIVDCWTSKIYALLPRVEIWLSW